MVHVCHCQQNPVCWSVCVSVCVCVCADQHAIPCIIQLLSEGQKHVLTHANVYVWMGGPTCRCICGCNCLGIWHAGQTDRNDTKTNCESVCGFDRIICITWIRSEFKGTVMMKKPVLIIRLNNNCECINTFTKKHLRVFF